MRKPLQTAAPNFHGQAMLHNMLQVVYLCKELCPGGLKSVMCS